MFCICASHSPLMLVDMPDSQPGRQRRFHDAIAEAKLQVDRFDPELVVVFAPDHFNGLFLDMMPAFCIPTQAVSTRDWGLPDGPLNIPEQLALDMIAAVRAENIDVAISRRMKVDHGTTIPLHMLAGGLGRFEVLPVVINCAAEPRPSFARVRMLGEAIGRYLGTLDKRILIIGSGGLSHDPPTPRLEKVSDDVATRLIDRHVASADELKKREDRVVAAANALVNGSGPCMAPDLDWDKEFLMRLMGGDFNALDSYTDAELDRHAGFGSHEVRCWVAAFAAMSIVDEVQPELSFHEVIPEWVTGMAVLSLTHKAV